MAISPKNLKKKIQCVCKLTNKQRTLQHINNEHGGGGPSINSYKKSIGGEKNSVSLPSKKKVLFNCGGGSPQKTRIYYTNQINNNAYIKAQ